MFASIADARRPVSAGIRVVSFAMDWDDLAIIFEDLVNHADELDVFDDASRCLQLTFSLGFTFEEELTVIIDPKAVAPMTQQFVSALANAASCDSVDNGAVQLFARDAHGRLIDKSSVRSSSRAKETPLSWPE